MLAITIPKHVGVIAILGHLFVEALKAVAPILVFVIVISELATSIVGRATINMGGATVTISVLTMTAAHTLDIKVDFFSDYFDGITYISAAGIRATLVDRYYSFHSHVDC